MKVYKHKDEDVIVWAVQFYSLGDGFNETKLSIKYSYLKNDGELGGLCSKVIYESDYSSQFKPTSREVELKWVEK